MSATDSVDEGASKSKKMKPEDIEKMAERLSKSNRKEVELKPLTEKKTITKEELDKRIKHLYDDSLARRAREREEIAQQQEREVAKTATMTNRSINKEEEEKLVKHLYDDTIELKKRNIVNLYQQETSHYTRNNRKLKPSEQASVADRLYGEGMARERSKHIALYNQYVTNRRPPAVMRSQADLAASADKMTKGEGVTS